MWEREQLFAKQKYQEKRHWEYKYVLIDSDCSSLATFIRCNEWPKKKLNIMGGVWIPGNCKLLPTLTARSHKENFQWGAHVCRG